jgi:hypothetical protein
VGTGNTPTGKVDVVVTLRSVGAGASVTSADAGAGVLGGTVTLSLCWDAAATAPPCSAAAKAYPYDAKGAVHLPALTVPNAKVWEIKSPALHTLTVFIHTDAATIGTTTTTTDASSVVDSCQVRFGLRIVSTAGRDIKVNGAVLILRRIFVALANGIHDVAVVEALLYE